jgi:hypothetical protein
MLLRRRHHPGRDPERSGHQAAFTTGCRCRARAAADAWPFASRVCAPCIYEGRPRRRSGLNQEREANVIFAGSGVHFRSSWFSSHRGKRAGSDSRGHPLGASSPPQIARLCHRIGGDVRHRHRCKHRHLQHGRRRPHRVVAVQGRFDAGPDLGIEPGSKHPDLRRRAGQSRRLARASEVVQRGCRVETTADDSDAGRCRAVGLTSAAPDKALRMARGWAARSQVSFGVMRPGATQWEPSRHHTCPTQQPHRARHCDRC